jgi:hypothetical protein
MLSFRQPPVVGANVVFLSSVYPQVSLDGGRTFHAARTDEAYGDYRPFDIQSVPSPGGRSAIMAQWKGRVVDDVWRTGPQLARTDDAGETWRELTIDLPGFLGAGTAVVTPTGRILAAALDTGIACSEDGGRTWGYTCATPDRAAA